LKDSHISSLLVGTYQQAPKNAAATGAATVINNIPKIVSAISMSAFETPPLPLIDALTTTVKIAFNILNAPIPPMSIPAN
jgi:hypothetical protein